MSDEKLDNLYTLFAPKWKDLFSKEVMIIDTKQSSILNRLETNKIPFKFYEALARNDPNDRYIVVHLRIKYKYADAFIETIRHFWDNSILLGYTDYQDYCHNFYMNFIRKDKEEND